MYNTLTITPQKLKGKVGAPPSKSVAHCAILCTALNSGVSKISKLSFSEDVCATISVVEDLEAEVKIDGNCAIIKGVCKGN